MTKYNTALVESMVSNGGVGSRENNDALYPRVVAGDAQARQEMIESNMSLVVDKVESYIRNFPNLAYLKDDLTSEGFVGLTTAVNKMATNGPVSKPNPTGYISHWILYHTGLVADREVGHGVSYKTVRRERDDQKKGARQVPLPKNLDNKTYEDSAIAVIELRDEILGCCETDEDRVIVEMREKGMVDSEIAQALNLPYTAVYLMRREIYRRFLEKTGMKGEV